MDPWVLLGLALQPPRALTSGSRDGPTRLEAAKQSVRAMGGELKVFYLVMGQYDAVVISEAPDDETATRFTLATAARGYVRTQTFRAYTEGEYKKIIASLP